MNILKEFLAHYHDKIIYYLYQGKNTGTGYELLQKALNGIVLKTELKVKKDEDIAVKIITFIREQGFTGPDLVVIVSESLFTISESRITNIQRSKCLFYEYTDLFSRLRKAGISYLLASHYEISIILKSQGEIERAYHLLSDTKSRQVFRNFLYFKFCFDITLLREIYEPGQYFVPDIFVFNRHEIFVDAGAHHGDTLIDFVNEVAHEFDRIYLFEPEQHNFSILKRYVQSLEYSDKVILFQKALFHKKARSKILAIGNCSELSALGVQSVFTIDLDSALLGKKVTFIKMDIEGAETKALQGAVKLIQTNKPKLAICTYHNIEDLWLVPLIIHSINPYYHIYLRHHDSITPSETVCYAV